ncbi:E3 ubiquitin-protein ligase RNF181-like [Paramacrobiotus metropolitanus]|uniref:E3 ubiquitin-protein ligase RNF181-like n=1 Tax=Paramacrobiotus metropolitanus TaxID=2943436 RepID=UPI002445D793|nr:E3 ubiquitin-protein ligase RNF181-like [Paramacrobiotus metropolitanus]
MYLDKPTDERREGNANNAVSTPRSAIGADPTRAEWLINSNTVSQPTTPVRSDQWLDNTRDQLREEMALIIIHNLLAGLAEAERAADQRARGTALTADEVENLRQATTVQPPTDENCPVCQEDYADNPRIIALPCHHVGHDSCLRTWLTSYSRQCPLCRQMI